MFENFVRGNSVSQSVPITSTEKENKDSKLFALFNECGGVRIQKGLYRVHTELSSTYFGKILNKYFPKYKQGILPFGFDWIGRQYCLIDKMEGVIAMFDPSTVSDFTISENIVEFHNNDLVNDRDATVSEEAFNIALDKFRITELPNDKCIGYKVPLFLGGQDDSNNYEIGDITIYWDMQCQLYTQIKNLPDGTKINSIKFKP